MASPPPSALVSVTLTRQISCASNGTSVLYSTCPRRFSRHAVYCFSGNLPVSGCTATSTLRSLGIGPPVGGSTSTKKLPVPTSGFVQTEMITGPTCRFSMIGKGGPLCASASGFTPTSSAQGSSHLGHKHLFPELSSCNGTIFNHK